MPSSPLWGVYTPLIVARGIVWFHIKSAILLQVTSSELYYSPLDEVRISYAKLLEKVSVYLMMFMTKK